MTTTSRLALPLIEPGQAQKEMFHNEALALIDAALHASATAVSADQPPDAPGAGESWIVGPHPTGAWADRAAALATWTAGGWRFVAAREGMAVWNRQAGMVSRFVNGRWEDGAIRGTAIHGELVQAGTVEADVVQAGAVRIGGVQVIGPRRAAIAAPGGGGVVDAEARAVMADILAALRAHGLIAGG